MIFQTVIKPRSHGGRRGASGNQEGSSRDHSSFLVSTLSWVWRP
jgi:hypothetical protein